MIVCQYFCESVGAKVFSVHVAHYLHLVVERETADRMFVCTLEKSL